MTSRDSISYNSDTFEAADSDTIKTVTNIASTRSKKSYNRSYGTDTFEPSIQESYSMDTFEEESSLADEYAHSYSMDNFESAPISESVQTAYSRESFESAVSDTYMKDSNFSRGTFSTEGQSSSEGSISRSYSDTVNSLSGSVQSVLASPRKSESQENRMRDEKSSQAERQFLQRVMQHLESEPKSQKDKITEPRRPKTKSERYTRKFCKNRIKTLRKQSETREAGGNLEEADKHESPLRRRWKETSVDEYGIPTSFVERLKITNILESMQQASQSKLHDPQKCRKCRKTEESLNAAKFISDRKARALDKLVKSKLEEHLYLRDELTLIGDIMSGMPNPNQTSEQVMQNLQQRYTTSVTDGKTDNSSSRKAARVTFQSARPDAAHLTKIMNDLGLGLDLDVPDDPREVWSKLLARKNDRDCKS